MLLCTLGASLLGNMSAAKEINSARYGSKDLRSERDGIIRAGYGSSIRLIL